MHTHKIRANCQKFLEKYDLKPYHLADMAGLPHPVVYDFLAGGSITVDTAIKLLTVTVRKKAGVLEAIKQGIIRLEDRIGQVAAGPPN